MATGETLIGLFLIAVAITAGILSAEFVPEATMVRTMSPAFYPRLLAGMLIFSCILLLVQAYLRRARQVAVQWGHWFRVLLAIAIMFFQVFAFEELGSFPSTGIALVLLLRLSKVPLWKCFVISGGFLVFMYVFFVWLLRLRFPMEFLPFLSGNG